MSKKSSALQPSYNFSDALYDIRRKEVASTVILSLGFLLAGIVLIIFSFIKYSGIMRSALEEADKINAYAWLIFAGVGLFVAAVGLVSVLKSLVSMSEIASSIKGMMTKASPFQPLNRPVTSMNQSQSMNDSPIEKGMAESTEKAGKESFLKKSSAKKQSTDSKSSKLYDRYNNVGKASAHSASQPVKTVSPPPKAKPSMVQKFDYGLDEYNKKSFAEEFLEKNKRDPFEIYRKQLGIKEEPKKAEEAKPQFIINNGPKTEAKSNPQKAVSTMPQQPVLSYENNVSAPTPHYPEPNKAAQVSPMVKPANKTAPSMSYRNVNQGADVQQHIDAPQYTIPQVHSYDDDFFLSYSNTTTSTPVYQQKQTSAQPQPDKRVIHPQHKVQKDEAANLNFTSYNNAGNYSHSSSSSQQHSTSEFKENSDTPTVQKQVASVGVHSQSSSSNREEKISKKASPSANIKEAQVTEIHQSVSPSTKDNLSQGIHLSYGLDDNSVFEFSGFPTSNIASAENAIKYDTVSPNSSIDSGSTLTYGTARPTTSAGTTQYQTTANSINKAEYDLNNFAPKESKPISSNEGSAKSSGQKSKSVSSVFSNLVSKKTENNSGDKQSHEICINGTRSQRKFVDASEYDEWSCPTCGKVNQEYVGMCACGTRKPRKK